MSLLLARMIAAFLSLACLMVVLASAVVLAAVLTAPLQLFGNWVTPTAAIFAMAVFVLAAIWFGFMALVGRGNPNGASNRKPPVSDPD